MEVGAKQVLQQKIKDAAIGVGIMTAFSVGATQGTKLIYKSMKNTPEFTDTKNVLKVATDMFSKNELHNLISKNDIVIYPPEKADEILNSVFGQKPNPMQRLIANKFKTGNFAAILDKLGGGYFLLCPMEKASYALHELGHLINYKNFPMLNKLVKSHNIAFMLIIGVAGVCAGLKDKISEKISNFAGVLTLGTFAPQLYDEFMASKRAVDAAKEVLPDVNVKPLKSLLTKAFSTYATVAVATAAGVQLAVNYVRGKNKTECE